jgi:hypothetical protein
MNREEAIEIIEGQLMPFGSDDDDEIEEAWNYIKENLK